METRSGIVSRLTDNPGSDDIDPAWSPDGRRLVWASGMPAAHDLFGMEADGTNKKRLVAGGADEIEPAWSPDAAQVAFASNRDGRYRLWTVAAAGGTEPTPVVEAPGQMRAPAWDPQGTHLAYTGVDAWERRRMGDVARRLRPDPQDEHRGFRRTPILVARRPPDRIRQQSCGHSADLADASGRQPPAGPGRVGDG